MSGASLTQVELDAAKLQAQLDGLDVVVATDDCLLLDIDTPAMMAQYEAILPILMEHHVATEAERWKSKSGNTHIRVALSGKHDWAVRYALEAVLGSDPKRGVLAVLQMLNGCDEASMLFRPKAKAEEEIAF